MHTEEEDKPWEADINEVEILQKAKLEEEERKKEEKRQKELQKRSSQGSLQSTDDKGKTDFILIKLA